MSQAGPAPSQKLVTELKVSGHLMTLEQGLFCVFHAPGGTGADPLTGLPGVRITHPPGQEKSRLTITSFSEDGWIGAEGSAALVRVNQGPSQLLVTIYQNGTGQHEAPKLQVMRIGDVATPAASVPVAEVPPAVATLVEPAPAAATAKTSPPAPGSAPESAEVAAHVQRRGDKLGKLGDWMGEPGSQSWIEGFAIAPNRMIGPEDIEYQAVLGKGWLSPWSEGGQYCGSRGMALPILGLRVRLKGKAAETHTLRVSATFTDGTKVGPLPDSETAEAESLAPLEAFRIDIASQHDVESDAEALPLAEARSRAVVKPIPGRHGASTAPRPAVSPSAGAAASKSAPKITVGKTVLGKTAVAKAAVKAISKAAGKQVGRKPGRPARR